MMVVVYKKKHFKIFEETGHNSKYIVYNTRKPFSDGHVHVRDFKLAKEMIDLSLQHRVPNKKRKFLISSLIILSDDDNYERKLFFIM